jgi:hypothetical protein
MVVRAQGGGKDESGQGVGTDGSKVPEAMARALEVYTSR